MPVKENETFESLVKLITPTLARLGHRSVEWKDNIKTIDGDCKHCGCTLKLQQSLFVLQAKSKKIPSLRWELITGNYVVAYLDATTNEFKKTLEFDNCLCSRLASML